MPLTQGLSPDFTVVHGSRPLSPGRAVGFPTTQSNPHNGDAASKSQKLDVDNYEDTLLNNGFSTQRNNAAHVDVVHNKGREANCMVDHQHNA